MQRTELVGKRMMKTFSGHGTFVGDIFSYDQETGYFHVTYEDGDKEDLSERSVQAGVRRFQQAQAKGRDPSRRGALFAWSASVDVRDMCVWSSADCLCSVEWGHPFS